MVLTKYFQKINLAIGRRFKISSLRQRACEAGSNPFLNLIKQWIATSCFRTPRNDKKRLFQPLYGFTMALLIFTTLSPVQAAWFNGDWSSREKITIKASQINGDLSEFPVYLNLADLPNAFFATVNGTGADIRMTLADEVTETSFELVEIDVANGTGELWFKAPLISSTIDTDFYIYYGNNGASAYTDSDPYGTHNVWSNGFAAVYHMNENPTGTVKDSTQHNNDGVSSGVMTSNDLVKGRLNKAIDFDGVNDYLITSLDPLNEVGTTMTVSGWAYSKASNNYRGIAGAHVGSFQGFVFGQHESGNLHFGFGNAASWGHGVYTTENLNTWSSYTMLINAGLGLELFKDGASVGTDYDGATISNISDFWIGRAYNSGDRYFNGNIDELRVSNKTRSANWISTEYKNQNSPGNFYLISNGQGTGFDSTLWSNKHKITIPASVINGDLENFPVYINLADLPFNFFGTVQASGADIRMTKADQETQLAFELVEINTVNKTGELWFKADTLSSTQDNIFYLWFGNAQAQAYSRSDEFGSENVWTEGYIGVWHMNEDPSQGQVLDSTKNLNDVTANGFMTSSDLINGKIGQSIDFDGIDDQLYKATDFNLDINSNFTISTWANLDSIIESGPMVKVGNTGGYGLGVGNTHFDTQGNNLLGLYELVRWLNPSYSHGTNWHFNNLVVNSMTPSLYHDKNLVGTLPGANPMNWSSDFYIGGYEIFAIQRFLDSTLDEVRIATAARSQNWIETEYLNQKDTGVFYTIDNGDLNNTAWSQLFKITILASQVNGDLTDFPVYVNLAHLPNEFFSTVNGSGADIRITTADRKTQTSFELVSLDTANGEGELWFKAPFLSSTTDTDFYLLAGNSNAEAYAEDHIFGAQNVWSNGFVAVYHLNEDPTGGVGAIKDSTKYNNDGTSNGAMTNGDLVTGQLGKAIDFDGSNDAIISNEDLLKLNSNGVSASCWMRSTQNESWIGLFGSADITLPYTGWTLENHLGQLLLWYSNNIISIPTPINDNIWNYVAFKKDSTSVDLSLNNFFQSFTGSSISMNNDDDTNFYLGNWSSNNGYAYDGLLDEIKISKKTRSRDWIKTEYNNQNSPNTFYTTEKVNRTNAVMFGRMF